MGFIELLKDAPPWIVFAAIICYSLYRIIAKIISGRKTTIAIALVKDVAINSMGEIRQTINSINTTTNKMEHNISDICSSVIGINDKIGALDNKIDKL